MILHIPHSSPVVPAAVRRTLLLTDSELDLELARMTDAWTDELFMGAVNDGDSAIVFPVSRLVADPERFEDDALEPMARIGMGAVYTKTSHGMMLRNPLPEGEKQALLDRYYRPHHAALEDVVAEEIARTGSALIIDCHSFPSAPLPYEIHRAECRPQICIGADIFHTPVELHTTATQLFTGLGFEVALDTPFSGAMVPQRLYRTDRAVRSVMIEIRRDLYMDEISGERLPVFDAFMRDLHDVINALRSTR